jgi:HemY protein
MIRFLAYLLLVLALGFGFSWFADRPGEVSLVWQGQRYETSLMVVLAALVALVAAILIVWWIVATILRSPAIMRRFFRNRRRDRGYHALSQGLIAAGSGNAALARRLARDSDKLLGSEPLVQLLDAQTLLLEGNREGARKRFEKMLEDDDTRLVALRGLHAEAEREGASEAARHYAEEAAKLSPSLSWAGNALLRYQCAEGDFEAALTTLEQNRSAGLIDKATAQRHRAVLLTARAMSVEPGQPDLASKLAQEAQKLAPDLAPAACVAAQALARHNDVKRAAKILETTWVKSPHPDIAAAYAGLRPGDSAVDRLKRAQHLASLSKEPNAEGEMAVADAAIAAREWKTARAALDKALAAGPTQRVYLKLAELEEAETGDQGRMRAFLARAVRAPRDAAWTADGMVSPAWLPISPVSGRIDAFEWKQPVAMIGHEAMPEEVEPQDDAVIEPEPEPAKVVVAEEPPAKPAEAAPEPEKSAEQSPPEKPVVEEDPAEQPNVVVMKRPPDDPGVDPEEEAAKEEPKRFRLF